MIRIEKKNPNFATATSFTQGFYSALIIMFGEIRANIDALSEFNLLRRRELEARIVEIEARLMPTDDRQAASSDIAELTRHLLQFGQQT